MGGDKQTGGCRGQTSLFDMVSFTMTCYFLALTCVLTVIIIGCHDYRLTLLIALLCELSAQKAHQLIIAKESMRHCFLSP